MIDNYDWYGIDGFPGDGRRFATYDEAREAGIAVCQARLADGRQPGAFQVVKYTSAQDEVADPTLAASVWRHIAAENLRAVEDMREQLLEAFGTDDIAAIEELAYKARVLKAAERARIRLEGDGCCTAGDELESYVDGYDNALDDFVRLLVGGDSPAETEMDESDEGLPADGWPIRNEPEKQI